MHDIYAMTFSQIKYFLIFQVTDSGVNYFQKQVCNNGTLLKELLFVQSNLSNLQLNGWVNAGTLIKHLNDQM